MSAQLPPAASPRPVASVAGRKCAETCLDLLTTEAVALFSDRDYGPAAPAALQAVGFRVGRQLAERCATMRQREVCIFYQPTAY